MTDRNRRILVQEVPLRVRAGRVEVGPAVAVEIRPGSRHSVRADGCPGFLGDVLEALAPDVAIQVLEAEVVGGEQVHAAVLVVVLKQARQRPARHAREPPRADDVGEVALAVVQEQEILAAVVGGERRIRHLAPVVARDCDEEVEVAVPVQVGERGRPRVVASGEARGGRRLLERPVASISEEPHRAERVGHDEVGVSVAVHVPGGHPGPGDAFRRRLGEAGLFRDVGEAGAPVVLVQDRPDAVGDEEILGAVAIEVENRHTRAGPDVGDQAVGQRQRRVGARRAESGLGRRVAKAGSGLDALGQRPLEADGRLAAGLADHCRRGAFDARAVRAESPDRERDRARRRLAIVCRLLDAVVDVAQSVQSGPGPRAQGLDAFGIRGRRLAAAQRPPNGLVGVAPALQAVHPRLEARAQPRQRGVAIDPPARAGEDEEGPGSRGSSARCADGSALELGDRNA